MPDMNDDWMFDITTSRAAMQRDDQQQQQQPVPQLSHAAGRQHPAASQESQAFTQAPALSEVPASVKEAVDRLESWSFAQQSSLLPIGEGPAAAVQPDEQNTPGVHSQQQHEDAAVKQSQQPQQQDLFGKQSQQQQQPGLFETQALLGEQREPQQRQQTLVQQQLPELCPAQSLSQPQQPTGHQHADQQHQSLSQLASQEQMQAQAPCVPQQQQQRSVRYQEQQQYKAPLSEYPGADMPWTLPMSQNEPPSYKDSSHAVGLIDATLAAINDTQTGPAAAAPPPQIQPPAAVLAGASGVGTKAAASVSSQRPPLHAHTSGLTLSSRPGFADAFANPSLYQQPWLHPATKSDDGANASGLPGCGSDHQHSDDPSRKQSLALHSTAAVGPSSAEAADRLGRTHSGSDRSTGHWSTTLCSAPTNAWESSTAQAGDVHHASEELGHLSTAQKDDQQGTSAPVAITSTNDCETALHVPEGAGLRVAQAAYQEAKAASEDRKSASLSASRSGGAGRDEACTGPSRWSAVNAYRLAREAAERAAQGAAAL